MAHKPILRPTRAAESVFNPGKWHVEQEFACINGLAGWFIVASCEEADAAEIGYTDGNFGSAEDRAKAIACALMGVETYNEIARECF